MPHRAFVFTRQEDRIQKLISCKCILDQDIFILDFSCNYMPQKKMPKSTSFGTLGKEIYIFCWRYMKLRKLATFIDKGCKI